jgi:hypothetical protein
LEITDRYTVSGLIEKINFTIATGNNSYYSDGTYPWHPDNPFNVIATCYFAAAGREDSLLTAGGRTYPAAISPANKKRTHKQQKKDYETSIYYLYGTCLNNKYRGQVIKRCGK